jgi:hypothetical protein
MRRQFLADVAPGAAPPDDVVEILRRLCGVQAQVASAAELAVGVRQAEPTSGGVSPALEARGVVKTWAMRGTLHLLAADSAAAYLALIAAARTWQSATWQKTFLESRQLDALADAVTAVLDGQVLTRDELVDAVVDRTRDPGLAEHLRSGWGAVLKPLTWQGLLCNGPSQGNRVTFARPDQWVPGWSGLPAPEVAARLVIPTYLGAHGPAPMDAFHQWLIRGAAKRAMLRSWFAAAADLLVEVDVEGRPAYALAADVDDIAGTARSTVVRLLPGFDQFVLGPGTRDPVVVPAERRGEVSKAAGWIAPVVVKGGRVVGTWKSRGDKLAVALFPEAGRIARRALITEVGRISALLGQEMGLEVM